MVSSMESYTPRKESVRRLLALFLCVFFKILYMKIKKAEISHIYRKILDNINKKIRTLSFMEKVRMLFFLVSFISLVESNENNHDPSFIFATNKDQDQSLMI